MTLVAFADESYSEAEGHHGFYVLAATVVSDQHVPSLRAHMLGLRPRPSVKKLHWKELEPKEKAAAVTAVATQDHIHVVTIGAPVTPRRQERARAVCMRHLVYQLHTLGVSHLICEARTQQLDRADVRVVSNARYSLPKGTVFRVDHQAGALEPALWCSDVVAGAIRGRQLGDQALWIPLETQVMEYKVSID